MSDPYESPKPLGSDDGELGKSRSGPSAKRWLLGLIKFAIPVAIIGFLVWKIDDQQWAALTEHNKDYGLLVLALIVAMVALAISFARWCVLVRCQGIELSMLEAQRLGAICFLLSFVSAGSVGGDLFKAVFLARRRPGKRIAAVASVLVDRGVGLYGLLLLVTIAMLLHNAPLDQEMKYVKPATIVLVVIGTIVLTVLVFGGRIVDRLIQWGTTLPLIGGLVEKVGPPLRMFHAHPIAFGFSILMSLMVHGLLCVSMYFVARGLYRETPTMAEHFVIVPFGLLMSALPIAPAGLGVLEATIERLYHIIPAAPTNASGTLVALVFELVKVVMGIIGTIFYWTANEEVRESLEEAEDESET